MSTARDRILSRIREALRAPAGQPPPDAGGAVFAPAGDPLERFQQEFAALKGALIADAVALARFLADFPGRATDGSELVRQAVGEATAGVTECQLGITGCDALVAQTGSIVVSAHSAGGRALSILPPVHLVIARRDQLVPDLTAALVHLRQRYAGQWPSNLSVITGPSRTADIEKILVMGAHGPKRLALFLAG